MSRWHSAIAAAAWPSARRRAASRAITRRSRSSLPKRWTAARVARSSSAVIRRLPVSSSTLTV
jgi:hypothetical protein